MSLLVFYLIVFIAVVLFAVAVSGHLYVVCRHFICLMSLLLACRVTEFYSNKALLLTQIDNLF